eukprot:scaffold259_cov252-Pinguiococcus_pyrenoidosus.AAC.37
MRSLKLGTTSLLKLGRRREAANTPRDGRAGSDRGSSSVGRRGGGKRSANARSAAVSISNMRVPKGDNARDVDTRALWGV